MRQSKPRVTSSPCRPSSPCPSLLAPTHSAGAGIRQVRQAGGLVPAPLYHGARQFNGAIVPLRGLTWQDFRPSPLWRWLAGAGCRKGHPSVRAGGLETLAGWPGGRPNTSLRHRGWPGRRTDRRVYGRRRTGGTARRRASRFLRIQRTRRAIPFQPERSTREMFIFHTRSSADRTSLEGIATRTDIREIAGLLPAAS